MNAPKTCGNCRFLDSLSGAQEGKSIRMQIAQFVPQNCLLRSEGKSEPIFGQGMRTATFQFSESGGSVNGPNLFTELPFP